MRILNIAATLDPVTGGGTAERTFQLVRRLLGSGVQCDLLTLDGGLTEQRQAALAGAGIITLPCLNERFFIPQGGWVRIRQAVAQADVVHLINHWTVLNAAACRAARRLGKPYVVCPAGALPIFGRSRWIKRIYNRMVGTNLVRQADGCVAVTADEIAQFQTYGVAPERVTVIPNGIEATEFSDNDTVRFRREFRLGDSPFILFVGRLNAIKGPDLLLQAFHGVQERFPEHHLVFAGPDGGMLSALQQMTAGLGMDDRVHFPGYLGGADKSRAYHAADLLVIPSRQEAMSIVVLEAACTGTPVLLTDRCGFDAVQTVGGGRVVPPTAEGLRSALLDMLSDPRDLRAMGRRLRDYTADRFSWDAAARAYCELFTQVLRRS